MQLRHVTFSLGLLSCSLSCGPSSSMTRGSHLEAGQDAPLSVMTYNIQSRPLLDYARAGRNLPRIGALVGPYDLVSIQECFARCQLLLNAATQPTKTYFNQRAHWWSLANTGLAALARLPLVDTVEEHYKARAELPDGVASKGILLTRYVVQGQTLDYYDTHMQAGSSNGAQNARRRQAEQLVAFVRRNSPPGHAVILNGDFNMGPHRAGRDYRAYSPNHYASAADMEARTSIFTAMQEELGLTDASDKLYGPIHDHIDRVLFRSGSSLSLTAVEWEERDEFVDARGERLSDGLPILVHFAVTATP